MPTTSTAPGNLSVDDDRTPMRSTPRVQGAAGEGWEMELAPPRLLLAEDDPEMRRMLAAVLRKDGYDVIEARNGVELLAKLTMQLLHPITEPQIELVISDLRMPGVTGLEALTGLRNSDWATPFILITAFGSLDVHDEARRSGAAVVLDKPFDIEVLRTAVANLLGKAVRSPATSQNHLGKSGG